MESIIVNLLDHCPQVFVEELIFVQCVVAEFGGESIVLPAVLAVEIRAVVEEILVFVTLLFLFKRVHECCSVSLVVVLQHVTEGSLRFEGNTCYPLAHSTTVIVSVRSRRLASPYAIFVCRLDLVKTIES